MVVAIAHDFTCPWCWIAWHQSQRLKQDLGIGIEWLSYELWPEDLPRPASKPADPPNPDRPVVPSRLELAYYASSVSKPRHYAQDRLIHNALQASEHAKAHGVGEELVARIYSAVWTEGLLVNDVGVLKNLATGIVPDPGAMVDDILARRYADKIVPFDEPAYALGVYNVPTFFIGGRRYAEQPYAVLERAIKVALR